MEMLALSSSTRFTRDLQDFYVRNPHLPFPGSDNIDHSLILFHRAPVGHAITGLLHRDNLMPGTGSMPVRQAAFVPLAVPDLHFEEAPLLFR